MLTGPRFRSEFGLSGGHAAVGLSLDNALRPRIHRFMSPVVGPSPLSAPARVRRLSKSGRHDLTLLCFPRAAG